jgi:hypothetical protein
VRQCVIGSEHAGQHPLADDARFQGTGDGEDSVKGALTNNARTHGQLRDFLSGVRISIFRDRALDAVEQHPVLPL